MFGLGFNIQSRSKKTKKILKKYLQDNLGDFWNNTNDRWQVYNFVIPVTWDSNDNTWNQENESLPLEWQMLNKNWNAETELWDEI